MGERAQLDEKRARGAYARQGKTSRFLALSEFRDQCQVFEVKLKSWRQRVESAAIQAK